MATLGGVCGSSEEVRRLEQVLTAAMAMLDGGLGALESGCMEVRDAWDDPGVQEVEEIVNSAKQSLGDTKDAVPALNQSLEAYAEFLDRT